MGKCKKDATPLLTNWSYVFLALTHRYKKYPNKQSAAAGLTNLQSSQPSHTASARADFCDLLQPQHRHNSFRSSRQQVSACLGPRPAGAAHKAPGNQWPLAATCKAKISLPLILGCHRKGHPTGHPSPTAVIMFTVWFVTREPISLWLLPKILNLATTW